MGGRRRAPAPAAPRRPASTSARQPAPAPAAAPPAPVQQSSGGGMLSGIGSTIAQGMAFGTGSAIAHRAVGAVAGSMSGGSEAPAGEPMQQQAVAQQGFDAAQGGACGNDKQLFFDCLKANNGDAQSCSFLYEQLQQCQQTASQQTFY